MPRSVSEEIISRATTDSVAAEQLVRAIMASGDSALVTGNQVELLVDGPETFSAIISAVEDARHHIHLETYIFADDTLGRRIQQLLIEKAQSGVQVRIIYDAFGSMATEKRFFDEMRQQGAQVVAFRPLNLRNLMPWRVNNRDHRKLLIVDGRVAFTGGINITEAYASSSWSFSHKKDLLEEGWRDTHVRIRGPAVSMFQKHFLETWHRLSNSGIGDKAKLYPPLAPFGSHLVAAVASRGDERDAHIYSTYLAAINNARESVYLMNAYFVPNDELIQALKRAAGRGVEVLLIVPAFTDFSLSIAAAQARYDDLLKSGVRIFERQDALLHAKTATIDGVVSIVGSANLDMRSFLHNNEINAVVVSSTFARQNEKVFNMDLQSCEEITLEAWRQRPMINRLNEFFGDLFSYWL